MSLTKNNAKVIERNLFILIVIIAFTIFIFTASGHRFSSDDYLAFDQGSRIFFQQPIDNFVPNETKPGLQDFGFIKMGMPSCQDPIICSGVPIGYSTSFIPFIAIEHWLSLVPEYEFTLSDFDDNHYVSWRNSLPSEETFSFLIYGPLFSALSSGLLFFITRTYGFSFKISTFIAFLYSFSTIAFAYSSTGLNVVSGTFLILLTFYFFRIFLLQSKSSYLILCSFVMGFSIIVRFDFIIFSIILTILILYKILIQKNKIKNIIFFILPLLFFVGIIALTNNIEFGSPVITGNTSKTGLDQFSSSFSMYDGVVGLLFSPGAGLFIFSPILFLIFISFYDFYKIDKSSLLFVISYSIILILFYSQISTWHGFVSWGARYLLPITPFLLLTLSASILQRNNLIFKIIVLSLSTIGFFFSLMWQIQDVSWFVWGPFGANTGLFALGIAGIHPLNLSPLVFWTFEYSQLTNAIILALTNLQPDMYLFNVWGIVPSSIILVSVLAILSFKLKSLLKLQ